MKKETIKERARLIESMHNIIESMNDERAYESWIWTVPDGADWDDFESIAEDNEEYKHVQELFCGLVKRYGGAGFFVDYAEFVPGK